MIQKLLGWIDTGCRFGAYLSALGMLVIVALISVEIGARSLFNSSTLIADEYSGYLMVTVVMLGLSYTFAEGVLIPANATIEVRVCTQNGIDPQGITLAGYYF